LLLFSQEKVKSFGIKEENMFTFWDVSQLSFCLFKMAPQFSVAAVLSVTCNTYLITGKKGGCVFILPECISVSHRLKAD
jgi:hypothetical protein